MAATITSEGKQYRVCTWLDRLRACSTVLRDARMALDDLDVDVDGLGAVRYDRERVSGGCAKVDAIGALVVKRDESREALFSTISEMRNAVLGGERVIRDAWKANAGVCDDAFRYVIEHYARGKSIRESAMLAGLSRYKGKLSARKTACMIYDAAPELFSGRRDGITNYFGYKRVEDARK